MLNDLSLLLAFSPLAVLVAGLTDLWLGDPAWMPHPVRWIGNGAQVLEKHMRRFPISPRVQGVLFTLLVLAGTGLLVGGSLFVTMQIHWLCALGVQVVWLHFGIATHDLAQAIARVHTPLHQGDIQEARAKVAWIVSRDTAHLDEAGVCRSGIESGAENTVDAIVAPWFWALVAGPVGLWLFKATSTLDSQVGYKTERYLQFGWASARLDDLLNWIPARLAFIPFTLAGLLCAGTPARLARAARTALRDRSLHASPNSGIGEAWIAGYLGVRLMGPNVYHGELCPKPWLGAEFPDAQIHHLRTTKHWIIVCGILCWLTTLCITYLLSVLSTPFT